MYSSVIHLTRGAAIVPITSALSGSVAMNGTYPEIA